MTTDSSRGEPPPKTLVVKFGATESPWWQRDLDRCGIECEVHYKLIPLEGGSPKSPFSWSFLLLLMRAVRSLLEARSSGYRYIVTFENDWLSFIFATLQTLTMMRAPRHIILQFVMRERTSALTSRLKYALIRWGMSSVHLCVCASSAEPDYYAAAFRWPRSKFLFVPNLSRREYLSVKSGVEDFVLSAGRTFRDYPTLLKAIGGTDHKLTIVAGRGGISQEGAPPNVTILYDIPLSDLIGLMARCMMVVVSLEQKTISVGQTVVLDAMALGKPVIVSGVSGVLDYVEHMVTAVVVEPGNPMEMRKAIDLLAGDAKLRRRLSEAGHKQVRTRHMPEHYAAGIARALRDRA